VEQGDEDSASRIVWTGHDGETLVLVLVDGEIKMVNPSFRGRSRLRVRVRRFVETSENERDPCFVVDLLDEAGERVTPLGIQVEEGEAVKGRVEEVLDVSIVAFAEELEVWEDESKYESAQRKREPRFESTSLVPIGPFADDADRAQPYAFLTGIVRETKQLKSTISGEPFVWALTETYGGSVDILATPKQVRRNFGIGSVVQGRFWLIGRLKGE
jgi:hypothetical protein